MVLNDGILRLIMNLLSWQLTFPPLKTNMISTWKYANSTPKIGPCPKNNYRSRWIKLLLHWQCVAVIVADIVVRVACMKVMRCFFCSIILVHVFDQKFRFPFQKSSSGFWYQYSGGMNEEGNGPPPPLPKFQCGRNEFLVKRAKLIRNHGMRVLIPKIQQETKIVTHTSNIDSRCALASLKSFSLYLPAVLAFLAGKEELPTYVTINSV